MIYVYRILDTQNLVYSNDKFNTKELNENRLEKLTSIKEENFVESDRRFLVWDENKQKLIIDEVKKEEIFKPYRHPETNVRLSEEDYLAYLESIKPIETEQESKIVTEIQTVKVE